MLGPYFLAIFSLDSLIMAAWLGIPLAILLRVLHTGSVVGPERLDPTRPAFPLVIAMMLAFCSLVLVSSGYSLWMKHGVEAAAPTTQPATHAATEPTTQPITLPAIDAVDSAFLYSAPSLIGLIMLLVADWMIGGASLLRRLGLERRRIGAGIVVGLIAAIVVLPLTYFVMSVADMVYKHFSFSHPEEHELLKIVGDSSNHPFARAILLISATFIAPVGEEIFFRGHLQTLLRRVLIMISRRDQRRKLFGFPVINPALPASAVSPLPCFADPPIATVAYRPVWQTWLAIVITSAIFASLHPGWMCPGIFLLALGLGYCYERTGNLWSNITLHFLFNSISTLVYLFARHA